MKLQLKKLEIEGFQTYKRKSTINFQPGVTYIKGINKSKPGKADSNGAGKTTIINAICWALYGLLPSGASAEEVIHWGSPSCCVHLDLGSLKVTRSRNKRKSTVEVEWKGEKHEGDVVMMNKFIQRILRISFKTFCASLMFTKTSTSVQFIKCSPAQRSEILSEFVNAEPFRIAGQAIAQDLKDLKQEKSQIEDSVEHQNNELAKLNVNIKQLSDSIRNSESIHQNKVEKLKNKMNVCSVEIKELNRVLLTNPEDELTTWDTERISLAKTIKSLEEEILELQASMGSTRIKINEGEECPACLRKVDRETAVRRSTTVVDLQATISVRTKDLKHRRETLEEVLAGMAIARKRIDAKLRAPKRLGELKAAYLEAKDEIGDPPSLQALREQLGRLLEDRKLRAATVEQMVTQEQKLKVEIDKREILYKGFGGEIKNLLFDQVRHHLSIYTQEYLRHIDGVIKINYPSSTKTGKEKFEIVVSQGGYEQSLESLSEGEHWRASFAVLLSLRRNLLDNAKSKLPILFIDDPVGGLDDAGTNVFTQVLDRLVETEKLSVLVTLPRESLIPKSAKTINVVLKNVEQGSYVEEN